MDKRPFSFVKTYAKLKPGEAHKIEPRFAIRGEMFIRCSVAKKIVRLFTFESLPVYTEGEIDTASRIMRRFFARYGFLPDMSSRFEGWGGRTPTTA